MGAAQNSWRRRFWPVWVAVGLPLILAGLNATPIGPDFFFVMMGIPILLAVWAGLGICALVLTVRNMRRREWSRAAVNAVLPLVILGAAGRFWQFIHLCNEAGDVMYFIAERSSYMERIRAVPPDGEPRLLVFDRGGMIWASEGYVYDESDEVVLAHPQQSARWRTRADGTELGCGYSAQPFPGHFSFTRHWYLAFFSC